MKVLFEMQTGVKLTCGEKKKRMRKAGIQSRRRQVAHRRSGICNWGGRGGGCSLGGRADPRDGVMPGKVQVLLHI